MSALWSAVMPPGPWAAYPIDGPRPHSNGRVVGAEAPSSQRIIRELVAVAVVATALRFLDGSLYLTEGVARDEQDSSRCDDPKGQGLLLAASSPKSFERDPA